MAAPIRKSAPAAPPRKGSYKGSGPNRKQWNGTRWVASPVSLVGGNMGRSRRTTSAASKAPKSNTTAAANARLKKQEAERKAALAKTKGNYNQSDGSFDVPSSSSSRPSSSSSTGSQSSRSSTSTGTSRRARTPQSKDMDANYAAFAKAHPKLAAKVKPGQAGYDAIQKALGKSGGSSTSSTSSSRTAPSNFGPSSDANEYAGNVEASRRRGTSGVGPLRSGQSYSDDVEKSRRPANRSAQWISANYRPGGAAPKPTQADTHYQSGNKFSDFDGGANPQRGSQKDFLPKKKSLKQALKEITDKYKRGRANPYN